MREKIINIIAHFAAVENFVFGEDNKLSDIGIDSLGLVELIVKIEEELDITFDDSALNPANLITVKNIVDLIDKTFKGRE